ncbi:MAG: hypothetical protein HOH19_13735 [Kordiimonadaceae bacterium]|nr:hypothetical protein [Kordiimonadaceae bacterium]
MKLSIDSLGQVSKGHCQFEKDKKMPGQKTRQVTKYREVSYLGESMKLVMGRKGGGCGTITSK